MNKNNEVAQHNVEKVVRFFKDKPVNVLSADILGKEQPAVVVVDPATFNIEEKVPTKPNPNIFVNGRMEALFTGDYLRDAFNETNPLMNAFDLTQSPERNKVQLTNKEMATLHEFTTKDPVEIRADFEIKAIKIGIPEGKARELYVETAVESVIALRDALKDGRIENPNKEVCSQWESVHLTVSGIKF